MHIDLVCTWEEARHTDMSGRTAVVIDVLRASSTVTAALDAGAKSVHTVATVEEARALADRLGPDESLLGGERESVRLPGFDLGNSPLEYTADVVAGKRVVMTTTNGTQAIAAAACAEAIVFAALVNAGACIDWLRECGQDVTIVCAGTKGRVSLDDLHCGGLIATGLLEPGFVSELNDGLRLAIQWFAVNAGNALHVLTSCAHGANLKRNGFGGDIEWCANVDSMRTVPVWNGEAFERA